MAPSVLLSVETSNPAPKSQQTMTVYVVGEHLMFGYGLESLLNQHSVNIELVGYEENFDHAVEQVQILQPDLIILYSHTPLSRAAYLAERILQNNNSVNLLSISVDNNKMFVYRVTQQEIKGVDDLIKVVDQNSLPQGQKTRKS